MQETLWLYTLKFQFQCNSAISQANKQVLDYLAAKLSEARPSQEAQVINSFHHLTHTILDKIKKIRMDTNTEIDDVFDRRNDNEARDNNSHEAKLKEAIRFVVCNGCREIIKQIEPTFDKVKRLLEIP